MMKKIERYLAEAHTHIDTIEEALAEIEKADLTKQPIGELPKLQRFAVEILIFRFAKLQDLLGSRLFRTYLDTMGFVTEGKSFFDLLKELENEGVLDLDEWAVMRDARNQIAHEYPFEDEDKTEEVLYVLSQIPRLIAIVGRIEAKYDAAENR